MRKLNMQDTFKMARIMKQANLKESIQNILIKTQDKNADVEKIGMDVVFAIIEACGEDGIETKVYDFLSGVWELDKDIIKNMDIESMINKFKEMAKVNNLTLFFKSVGQLS